MNFGVRRAYLDENPHLITLTDKEKQLRLPFNRNKLLHTYYNIVSEYYKSLESYYGIIKDYDINMNDKLYKEGLTEIKKDMVKIYVKILKIRKILSTIEEKGENYEEGFKKVNVMEDLITNFIDLLENRWRTNVMKYEDDFEINSVNVKILRLELMKEYKFLITHKPNIEIEEELKIAREQLEMLEDERAKKMDLQKKARRIVHEPVHKYEDVVPAVINPNRVLVKRAPPMPATIIAERQSTPSFPFPQANPQEASAASRISRTPRTSQKPTTPLTTPPTTPLTLEELIKKTDALLKAAIVPDDIRVIPSQSPARRRLLGLPPLAPLVPLVPAAAPNRGKIRPHIQPIPKVAPELLAQVMPSRSHSFKSNSPENREEVVIDIEGDMINPPKVYLIDNKDDGLCFLNAIFDYLLYSDKLSIMYERLSAIENLILQQDKYKANKDIQNIKEAALSQLGVLKGTYILLEKKIIPITQERDKYYLKKKEQGQLIRLTGIQKDSSHPEYEDYTQLYYTDTANKVIHLGHPKGAHTKPIYEEQRINFAKSMKYMVALYILSYGKRKFIENIRLVLITERTERGNETAFPNDWNDDLITKFEIGNISDNFDDFVYQYVFEYMSKDNFFANEILMSMFNKILFKKIKDANGKNIPRFWLEVAKAKTGHGRKGIIPTEDKYLNLREDRKFTRVLNKYRFKTSVADAPLNKYIHTDYKYDNYISLLCDEDRLHFLLFLLEEELKYQLVDKPKRGGKPKRPKTATKRPKTATKRPKTATKRPKTAK
jgi:hypothetical protein